jgi:hypothetical protein
MRAIVLDASDWKTTSDFYDALLSALGVNRTDFFGGRFV